MRNKTCIILCSCSAVGQHVNTTPHCSNTLQCDVPSETRAQTSRAVASAAVGALHVEVRLAVAHVIVRTLLNNEVKSAAVITK